MLLFKRRNNKQAPAFGVVALFMLPVLFLVGCDQHQGSSSAADQQASLQRALQASISEKPVNVYAIDSIVDLAHLDSSLQLSSPAAKSWSTVTEYMTELAIAPPVHPSISLRHDPQAPTLPVNFSVATDSTHFYLRLRWLDSSEDKLHSFDKFADAVAVQFALNGGKQTSFMMGSVSAPVNMWYWNAAKAAPQNLVASGFGTVTSLPAGDIKVHAEYMQADSTKGVKAGWLVVFSRPLSSDAEQPHQVALSANAPVHFSLAVWQGLDKQRDGLKRIYPGWISVSDTKASDVADKPVGSDNMLSAR